MAPGQPYRWEEHNHGLEHKCGTCKTPLSNPRAKKTCLGVHEEVCIRYHKTLFFPGQSHNCDACRKTTEQHVKRHRSIIALIHRVRLLDGALDEQSLVGKKKRARQREKPETFNALCRDDVGSEEPWNDSSTLNGGDDDDQCSAKASDKSGKRQLTAQTKPKAARQQANVDVITKAELSHLNQILHPDQALVADRRRRSAQGLLDNATIEDNITFHANIWRHKLHRQAVGVGKHIKANASPKSHRRAENAPFIDDILQDLGINPQSVHVTKDRKNLSVKLCIAISRDMAITVSDEQHTMQRMAGYWRFANRRTYNAMVRMNQLWDWATGEKLPEIEEPSGPDDLESETAVTVDSAEHPGITDLIERSTHNVVDHTINGDLFTPEELASLALSDTLEHSDSSIERKTSHTTTGSSTVLGDEDSNGGMLDLEESTQSIAVHEPPRKVSLIQNIGTAATAKSKIQLSNDTQDRKPNPVDGILKQLTLTSTTKDDSRESPYQIVKQKKAISEARSAPPLVARDRTIVTAKETKSDTFDRNNRFGQLNNEICAPREEFGPVEHDELHTGSSPFSSMIKANKKTPTFKHQKQKQKKQNQKQKQQKSLASPPSLHHPLKNQNQNTNPSITSAKTVAESYDRDFPSLCPVPAGADLPQQQQQQQKQKQKRTAKIITITSETVQLCQARAQAQSRVGKL